LRIVGYLMMVDLSLRFVLSKILVFLDSLIATLLFGAFVAVEANPIPSMRP
jgi:hypothetical protein